MSLEEDFQKLQVVLAQAVEARQQLDAQLSENQQVKKVLIHDDLSMDSELNCRV
jgi:chaperonin cofactor prefoldin